MKLICKGEVTVAKHHGLNFYHKKKKINPEIVKDVISVLAGSVVMVLIAFLLVFTIGMKTSIIGVSMEPTLHNGQEVLINRFQYLISNPQVGDVVVFQPNGNENTHLYAKRVVAVPGDKLQIKDGKLYVNNQLSNFSVQYDKIADPGMISEEMKLGKDEYFVLGDNCNNSEDSRYGNIGPVKKEYIIGKIWFHFSTIEDSLGFVKSW